MKDELNKNERVFRRVFFGSGDIEDAVNFLDKCLKQGTRAFIEFNGVELYGGIDTVDTAYIRVTGKTREQMKAAQAKQRKTYQEEYEAHQSQIPMLKMEWAKKGREVLKPMYHEAWQKAVTICLGDIYMGTELEPALQIAAALNAEKPLSDVMEIVRQQGLWSRPVLVARDICARCVEFAVYFSSNC